MTSGESFLCNDVSAGLRTRYVGQRLRWFDTVGSTNDVARTLAYMGEPEGTVVVAQTQTAGRGRLGRRWVSPPGGLWFSVILRPIAAPHDVPLLGLAAAVAASRGIERACGVRVGLRWPNDLIVARKKVGGILAEAGPEIRWVVVGIGINANVEPDRLPEGATSLSAVVGEPVDRAALLRAILAELETAYEAFRGEARATLLGQWRERATTLGKRVRVDLPSGTYEGVAESVDEDGALILRLPGGRTKRIVAGEVTG
ncbi:MAG: biotin--[acetyl-CoA-carboxylase] ligase [Armatimonadota bacterium]|nr:biotin--[acetyl-CoA-carboxylase] ligase [Armatimonadota bacterium]MDR5697332.1 biotin--[acetyl-CoA-carboxylase] ligase [Armatimonadota bacterium]